MYDRQDFIDNGYFGISPSKALDRVRTFDVAMRNCVTLSVDLRYMIKAKNFKEFLIGMQQTLDCINRTAEMYNNPKLVEYVARLPHNAPYLTRFQV